MGVKMNHRNSFIIIDKVTNIAIVEIWNEDLLEHLNTTKYEVKTAYEYLCELNKITQINKM